ncbi:uncharacterized protein METZ01_LOCUS173209, partial [marine metagenome]
MRLFQISATAAVVLMSLVSDIGADDDTAPSVYQDLADKFAPIEVNNIRPAPVPGLLEILVEGEILYATEDGRFLFRGDIFDATTRENLTEIQRNVSRKAKLNVIDEESLIVFQPDETKYTVNVFTDIDCSYCLKFHRDMESLGAKGIRVRYLFFPRAGPGSESWQKANSVWCSDDRKEAMTRAKLGADLEVLECGTTPVAQHYELGKAIGIQGTPVILTESGEMLGGYVPPS